MALDWQIEKRSDRCCLCQVPFREGQEVMSALVVEEAAMVRTDVCLPCFPLLERDVVSCWKVRILPPEQAASEPVPADASERILRKFMAMRGGRARNVRYILAAMLERKRILVQRDRVAVPEEGKTILIFEHRKTGETFPVEDPRLSLSDIRAVQETVREILDGELADPPRGTPENQETSEGIS